jgi:hypothetical protein
VCAPVHDAILVMAPTDRIEADVARARAHGRSLADRTVRV